LTLAEALAADDAEAVAAIISDWEDIDRLVQEDGGELSPLLFVSVYADRPKIAALLLKRGANPELGMKGFSALKAVLARPNCLPAFLAAGFDPRVAVLGMSGVAFERTCGELLSVNHYDVRAIGRSGDQGADLIATRDGLSYAIQCKDYAGTVGNAAVQEVIAAKHYHLTDFAVVCAPNGFTRSARELAARTGVILIAPPSLPDIATIAKAIE
jgi:hypothetical protein